MNERNAWLSVHVFYHSEQDELLIRCISPLAETLKSQGLVSKIFYLRHWQGGPHLRLRLHIDNYDNWDTCLQATYEKLSGFLERYPSHSLIGNDTYHEMEQQLGKLENLSTNNTTLYPNNSIKIETYKPEIEKYGGVKGIAIAEDLFSESTLLSLRLLDSLNGSREKKIGQGFIMLIIGALAFGIPAVEMPAFLSWYQDIWSRYVPPQSRLNWEARLKSNHERLEEWTRAIIYGRFTMKPIILAWKQAIESASAALIFEGEEVLDAIKEPLDAKHKKLYLLINYLHTHNNRLGILVTEEAYLGFLSHHVVQDVLIRDGYI